MQEKLLKKIISAHAGPGTEKLVDIFYKKQNVNEFLIAKKLNLTINQTRNVLYKLADEGMVRFIRKKDKKKGGWYTYFWTLEVKKALQKNQESLNETITNLEKQLTSREHVHYYNCKNCDIEYDEEPALLNNYICPECGEILQVKNSVQMIENIKKEVEALKKASAVIQTEIQTIEEKEQKVRQKKLRAEQKKKEEERRKKRAEREKAKKKLAKTIKKKKFKKKKPKSIKKKISKKSPKKKTAKKSSKKKKKK